VLQSTQHSRDPLDNWSGYTAALDSNMNIAPAFPTTAFGLGESWSGGEQRPGFLEQKVPRCPTTVDRRLVFALHHEPVTHDGESLRSTNEAFHGQLSCSMVARERSPRPDPARVPTEPATTGAAMPVCN
jgi:hypothetical protein